jgi:hypothetical protein
MTRLPSPDVLGESRHITLILRALVRHDGHVLHGEVIDAESGERSPFVGGRGLIRAIRSRLESLV